jgi:calcium/calmodulin-dependent protein kinase (CaM kinase) II
MTPDDPSAHELLDATRRLLQSIARSDWETYSSLCDPTLTCFEPESQGILVEGMDFHYFYFNLSSGSTPANTTICSPHVRVMGDVGIVSYVRLVQRTDADGKPVTVRGAETRVWHRRDGQWRHVHFHRSVG